MEFAKFMAQPAGRALRVFAGLACIAAGFGAIGGAGGMALGAFGVVAVLAGSLNFCLIAPLLGVPFQGTALSKR